MSVQGRPVLTSSVRVSWARIPGRNVRTPVLEIDLARPTDGQETFVEEIQIAPPRTWRPGTVVIGPDAQKLSELRVNAPVLNDSYAIRWEVEQRVTPTQWTLSLRNTQPKTALPKDWSLRVAILLDKPAAENGSAVLVRCTGVEESLSFDVPPQMVDKPFVLRLESDPKDTTALARGQRVSLRWNVQNIEGSAELRGSLEGANTLRIANGSQGQCSVVALGEAVYSLRATVIQGGELVEKIERVQVNLKVSQFGLQLEFLPPAVFPGGPIVCYYSAYNVEKITFLRTGDQASLEDKNYDAKTTDIVDRFVVPYGPAEGQNTSFGAMYTTAEGDKTAQSNSTQGVAPKSVKSGRFQNLLLSFGSEDGPAVRGLAAGTFVVVSQGPNPVTAKREWMAIARPSGLELWVRDPKKGEFKAPADFLSGVWKNNWLEGAISGQFLGVGASALVREQDNQSILAVRKVADAEDTMEVLEIDLPLQENNPPRTTLTISDIRFASGTVRVLTVGNQVFLFGNGVAISYVRNMQMTSYQDEPRLACVAFPEWELVSITNGPDKQPTGCVFALEKQSGMLLRFDVVDGSVTGARVAANANGGIAPLDKLQAAQASLTPTPPPFPRDQLQEGRAILGQAPDGSMETMNAIDEKSVMVALGGVLLVRSQIADPSAGDVIQDRAYDPRLDVWTRCGHPFAEADKAPTRFFAATPTTLYCLADDQLYDIVGQLPSYLGFMASDYTPIAAASLAAPSWPENFTFPVVDNKTPFALQWLNGRMDPAMYEQGRMHLALMDQDEIVFAIEAQLDRATGAIESATAKSPALNIEDVRVCTWTESTLTIAPLRWSLEFQMPQGIVLPFLYSTREKFGPSGKGDGLTNTSLEGTSLSGQVQITIQFMQGTTAASAKPLDGNIVIILKNGAIADVQPSGQHATRFELDVEQPFTLVVRRVLAAR